MASIAMARAALEVLLTDVHKAHGKNLEDKIQYIKQSGRLPGDVMHRIQKTGDAILHSLKKPTDLTAKKASQTPSQIALQLLSDLKRLTIQTAYRVPWRNLIGPMLARFMATDRAFAKLRASGAGEQIAPHRA